VSLFGKQTATSGSSANLSRFFMSKIKDSLIFLYKFNNFFIFSEILLIFILYFLQKRLDFAILATMLVSKQKETSSIITPFRWGSLRWIMN
jgi:hypothetical protein